MSRKTRVTFAIIGSLAVLAFAAGDFVLSGVYNIGADDHYTKLVLAAITQLRDNSIAARAREIVVPNLDDPRKITAGANRYEALCVGCHLAPGVTKSDIRPGLYPHPPNLAQEESIDAQRGFWIIKHGIKMSAMPAWGKSLDDAEIWDIVSFLQKMPAMSHDTYLQFLN
jgi:mono/diheme cytochrome c family protein